MNGIETRPLRDRAYDEIKHRIVTMAYRPGEYLNEARISEETGIGRTPVHQALDRLMTDGMVEVIPRKGIVVRPISLDEVRHVMEARLVNESYCARIATERATEDDLDALSGILTLGDTMDGRDTLTLMHLDREFHLTLARATGNPVLSAFVASLQERLLRFWFMGSPVTEHADALRTEHRSIHDAVVARRPDAAAAAMTRHLEAFHARILQATM